MNASNDSINTGNNVRQYLSKLKVSREHIFTRGYPDYEFDIEGLKEIKVFEKGLPYHDESVLIIEAVVGQEIKYWERRNCLGDNVFVYVNNFCAFAMNETGCDVYYASFSPDY